MASIFVAKMAVSPNSAKHSVTESLEAAVTGHQLSELAGSNEVSFRVEVGQAPKRYFQELLARSRIIGLLVF